MKNEYIDQYGNITNKIGNKVENGNLFRAITDNFCRLLKIDYYPGFLDSITNTIVSKNRFQANPPENGDHFSRDNMLGLYCQCAIHNMKKTMKQLPLMVWNGYKWYNPVNWHPNTWAVFITFKYRWLKYVNPLLYIMGVFSLMKTDYMDTSGKNLWFLTFTVLDVKWPITLAEKKWAKKRDKKLTNEQHKNHHSLFNFSHQYYFTRAWGFFNPDQPVRILSHKYYREKGIN